MSTMVILEDPAQHDGGHTGRQAPNAGVPSLALDKVPSLRRKGSGNTAAMSQTSKPDSEPDTAPGLVEGSPRQDMLTSEQVAALEGEARGQAATAVQPCVVQTSQWAHSPLNASMIAGRVPLS